MTTALLLQYGVPAAVAAVSVLAGHWLGSRSKSAPTAKPTDLLAHPAVQIFLTRLISVAQASQHSAMDSIISRLWPAGAAAITPIVNQVADAVENKITGK